jgi:hypothetical protein
LKIGRGPPEELEIIVKGDPAESKRNLNRLITITELRRSRMGTNFDLPVVMREPMNSDFAKRGTKATGGLPGVPADGEKKETSEKHSRRRSSVEK